MANCEIIHETIVRDIVDVVSDVADSGELVDMFGKNKAIKSINQATSNLVLVFPVLTSRNLDIENAAMVTKAIERKCVSLLQILFSAVSITNATDAIDFVKQYHTNLGMSGDLTVDEFIGVVDDLAAELESAGLAMVDSAKIKAVREDMRNINYFLPDAVSEASINDYRVMGNTSMGKCNVVKRTVYTEAKGGKGGKGKGNGGGKGGSNRPNPRDYGNYMPDFNSIGNTYTYNQIDNRGNGIGGSNSNNSRFRQAKDASDYFSNQILDTDIKKANELMPTTMVINFISNNGDGDPIAVNNVVIGVKAKMYPINSDDLITRIKLKNSDKNGFHMFLRAATREISFFKDLIFAIDRAKMDALSTSKRGSSSKMWKVLERRALKSKVRRSLRQINDATAITTLVMSQDEVELLKRDNINMEDLRTVRPIMEAYNLMGICIVDESLEVAKFIFDTGDDDYETLSFRHLERESSDSSYKKVVNLMTKLSR